MLGKVVLVIFILALLSASVYVLFPGQVDRLRDNIDVAKADLQARAVQTRNDVLQGQVTPEMVGEEVAAQAKLAALKARSQLKEEVRSGLEGVSVVISPAHDSRLVRVYRTVFWNRIPLIGAVTRAYDRLLDHMLNLVGARGASEAVRVFVKLTLTMLLVLGMLSPLCILI